MKLRKSWRIVWRDGETLDLWCEEWARGIRDHGAQADIQRVFLMRESNAFCWYCLCNH